MVSPENKTGIWSWLECAQASASLSSVNVSQSRWSSLVGESGAQLLFVPEYFSLKVHSRQKNEAACACG